LPSSCRVVVIPPVAVVVLPVVLLTLTVVVSPIAVVVPTVAVLPLAVVPPITIVECVVVSKKYLYRKKKYVL
jgi:hypothetical protein